MLGPTGHAGHLFRIESRGRKVTWSNSGYTQDIWCVVCREEIKNVDGEFLKEKVTNEDIKVCLALVIESRDRENKAIQILSNELLNG